MENIALGKIWKKIEESFPMSYPNKSEVFLCH